MVKLRKQNTKKRRNGKDFNGNGVKARKITAIATGNKRLAGVKYFPAMFSNFHYRNMDEYFLVFSQSRRNKHHDVTAFLKFALRGAVESLNEIKDKITFFIRKFALQDCYTCLRREKLVTRRQHDFLVTLLESNLKPFTLKNLFAQSPYELLYRDVTERTARRDLNKLKN